MMASCSRTARQRTVHLPFSSHGSMHWCGIVGHSRSFLDGAASLTWPSLRNAKLRTAALSTVRRKISFGSPLGCCGVITHGNMERWFQDVPGVSGGSRMNATDDLDRENVTALINEARAGGKIARDRLFRAIYEEFHRIAKVLMSGERCGHSLHPSDVVNEAVIGC